MSQANSLLIDKGQQRAAFLPTSLNAEERSIECTWGTTQKVLRYDWMKGQYFYEELSFLPEHVRMQRLESGAPVLDNHDSWRGVEGVLGVVEDAALSVDHGTAVLRFGKGEKEDRAWQKVTDGIVRGISVGYYVHQYDDLGKQDDDEYPTYRAIDWEPHEISLAPIPADIDSAVRSGEQPASCKTVSIRNAQPPKQEDPSQESNQARSLQSIKRQIQINQSKAL